MRTTINLDDDIVRVADQLARSRAISRGEAISELARRGVQQHHKPLRIRLRNGFAVMDANDTEMFSSDDVASGLSKDDIERAQMHQ